jgi:threonine aldolase
VDTNAVFLRMDPATVRRVREAGWEIDPFDDGSVRLMCSWATTKAQVEEVAEMLKSLV